MTALGLAVILGLSWLLAGLAAYLLDDWRWLVDLWDDRLPDPMPDDWCQRAVERSTR